MDNNYIHIDLTIDGNDIRMVLSVSEAHKLQSELQRQLDIVDNFIVEELNFDDELVLDNYVAVA